MHINFFLEIIIFIAAYDEGWFEKENQMQLGHALFTCIAYTARVNWLKFLRSLSKKMGCSGVDCPLSSQHE